MRQLLQRILSWAVRVLSFLSVLWVAPYTAARVLWACRAPALSVAIGLLLIVDADQARDIVMASGTASAQGSRIFVAVVVWAVVGWYWSRVTLDYAFACPQPVPGADWHRTWHRLCIDHVPRLIGVAAIWSVAWAFCIAGRAYRDIGNFDTTLQLMKGFFADSWHYVGYGAVFYALVWLRKPTIRYIIGRTLAPSAPLARTLTPDPMVAATVRDLLANPIATAFLVLTLLAAPIAYIVVASDPIWFSAQMRGAVPVVLLGLALIVPATSALVLLAARMRVPVFGLAALWLVFGPSWFGDFHDVRTCRSLAGAGDPVRRCAVDVNRPALRETFHAWWHDNARPEMTKPIGQSQAVVPPMIMVATAGGASRAAFWTTQVLGEIAKREAHFADRMFMMSGVSGGSLGATLFRSLVEVDRRATDGKGSPLLLGAPDDAARFMDHDFLGPTLAAGLYVDLPTRSGIAKLLPKAWQPDDRAAALEKSWERAWSGLGLGGGAHPLAWTDGFSKAFGGAKPWPLLALNGTSVEKGKRIITTNVSWKIDPAASRKNISGGINRYDAFDILQSDIPISTAVTMSARFPVVSPTGALRDGHDKVWSRVTDGGLFENFGAYTAEEVTRYLVSRISEVADGDYQTAPIAILISSDPSLDRLLLREDGRGKSAPPDCAPTADNRRPVPRTHAGNGWEECPASEGTHDRTLTDPVLALYDGRVARGEAAATSLSDRIKDLRPEVRGRLIGAGGKWRLDINQVRYRLGLDDHVDFFHFRQCRLPNSKSPTMSWHDSKAAWAAMRDMLGLVENGDPALDDPCGNRGEFFRLCVRLARLSGDAKDDEVATDQCETRWTKPKTWRCPPNEHLDAPPEWRRPYCRLMEN